MTGKIESIKATYFANCISNKEVKWLDKDNAEQIEWVYDSYLASDNRDFIILQNIFIPQTLEDKYNQILASLDVLSNQEYSNEIITKNLKPNENLLDYDSIPKISLRDKVIKNMQGAWNKPSNSSEDKEVIDIEIYKKNLSKFKAIVELEGKTPKKIINEIIEDEYKSRFSKG